ncbi:inositol 1,4,5-triphosphate receptor associated 2-like [Bufo bufo]|uniref:inositol 1,4,5-triphosphate receptor associated 2-like n=1 Tax=Bufo bufo TaxID=8384 RepID=UPI001ABECA4D|nr:inositol 1,4,5-triphosphate receptor associated 2-like [Bufo bufo]
MSESGSATKRHNPVDSIRRKIKTIEMRDQESNPSLQIPKFQSRNFDSPQSNTKKNLEEVLKNRAMRNTSKDLVSFSSPGNGTLFSPAVQSPSLQQVTDCASLVSKDQNKKVRSTCGSQSCSTPLVGPRDTHFKFQSVLPSSEYKSIILEDRLLPSVPSFYFDRKSDHFTLKSPVVKRLSMSESAGLRLMMENKPEPAAEVSLICEEDLLDSIFYACDTEHRGKVAVSKIVDYLRHTTSRGSEDSGLSELCNMLDPEKRDISMDLDTYHAIMREWVDDCRNNGTENKTKESILAAEDSLIKLREGLIAVRRISGTTMNVTCGSLEAFGGDVSRGDLDTSDLITCIADLQYNNQKLKEQHGKLKAAIEAQEESNHRLLEENETLRNHWKSAQQSITRVRTLKGEIEELKLNMTALEESKSQLVAQNKQMEKENLSLIHKISSLQDENLRGALEVEEIRNTLSQVTDKVAELQLQLTDLESALQKKDAGLLVKDLYVEEMKSSLMEYSSVIENLRNEKSKMESNLQRMEQELLSNGINSPITCQLNRVINGGPNSLHTELEYAQHSLEVSTTDWMFSAGRTSSLDVTLDREVLLLLQGPGHEQVAADFKAVLQTLQEDTSTIFDQLLVPLQHLIGSDIDVKVLSGKMLEILQKDLRERRKIWEQSLKQLGKHKDSLDKEFAQLSGNLRRMKTEQLHLKKELTARLHDLEATRHQQEKAEGKEATILSQLQASALKQEDLTKQIEELEICLHTVRSEADELQRDLKEAQRQQQELQSAVEVLTSDCRSREQKTTEQEEIIKLLQDQLLDYQSRAEGSGGEAEVKPPVHGVETSCICEEFGVQESSCFSGRLQPTPREEARIRYTPLLDALSLEGGKQAPSYHPATANRWKPDPGPQDKKPRGSASSQEASLIPQRPEFAAVGVQTDEEIFSCSEMEKSFSKEICSNSPPETVDATSICVNSRTSADCVSSPLDNTLASSAEASTEVIMMHAEKENAVERSEDSSFSANGASSVQHKSGDCSKEDGSESSHVKPKSEEKQPPPEEGSLAASLVMTSQPVKANHSSNNEKEMEGEFLRLSLGFKCDIFTLDKRLRLEERSRELAEENLKKELAGCKKLLEALTPLCEEDNQTHEIVKKLEKSLQFLSQHTARVASRSEMLGAIHQENRVSKAVEVMIQHVENLKRMYTKEHTELEELRQTMHQNERASCATDREDSQKLASSLVSPARRVSMPAYPRGLCTGSPMDLFGEKPDGKLQHRRSNSWKLVGSRQNENRPTLQRFVDNCTRPEPSEDIIKEDEPSTALVEDAKEELVRKYSYIQKTLPPTKANSTYSKVLSWTSDLKRSIKSINKPVVISVLAIFLLVTLLSFLVGLSFYKPADGAPVGTGTSWTSVQQLLWPYTGLHHNAPPPV